jgi:AI-2 transport protein TqsA
MEISNQKPHKSSQLLLILATSVIIVAGMKAAESLIVPFLLAAFITIITTPPFLWLQKKGIPKIAAMLLIIFSFLIFIFLIGVLIGTSISDFTINLPVYEVKLKYQTEALIGWLIQNEFLKPDFNLIKIINPSSVLQFVGDALNQFSGLLADGFLILFTVIFMLLEISNLPLKIKKILPNPDQSMIRVNTVYQKINKYIGIQSLISLGTGLLVYIFLLIVGVDYPLLWGVLAFVLSFVPTIGSIISLIPPVLLTIIQLGFVEAIIVLAGFIVINTLMANIIGPKFMGKGLGLSTLVVFISLIFWGWVLGPIGMLLSVPLTITIKIALDSSDETRWLSVLLGPDSFE